MASEETFRTSGTGNPKFSLYKKERLELPKQLKQNYIVLYSSSLLYLYNTAKDLIY